MNFQQKNDRIASTIASYYLKNKGYQVEKTTGYENFFHLIAWKGNQEIIFIRIRRTRQTGLNQFYNDIARLSEMVKRRSVPGIIELWIFSRKEWKRYKILEGGAVPNEIGVIS